MFYFNTGEWHIDVPRLSHNLLDFLRFLVQFNRQYKEMQQESKDVKKPLIGITLDYSEDSRYAAYPWYALRENYFEAVERAGGVPLGLPYTYGCIDDFLDQIDGLIIPGGLDMHPKLYAKSAHPLAHINDKRSDFDYVMLKKALERKTPFLGICAGQQMLNVVLGGTLHQHIPDTIPHALEHDQKIPRHLCSHPITIEAHTRLHAIAGTILGSVNSTHHQAVDQLGKGLRVSAYAPDGVIEAIELEDHPFCMGVEWHPEYQQTALDRNLFVHFIQAAGHATDC